MRSGFIGRFFNEFVSLIRGQVVLVYTMGKVSSTMVRASLEKAGVVSIHIHNFSGADFGYFDRRLFNSLA